MLCIFLCKGVLWIWPKSSLKVPQTLKHGKHILTQHEELMVLIIDTLSIKPISAIICEKH